MLDFVSSTTSVVGKRERERETICVVCEWPFSPILIFVLFDIILVCMYVCKCLCLSLLLMFLYFYLHCYIFSFFFSSFIRCAVLYMRIWFNVYLRVFHIHARLGGCYSWALFSLVCQARRTWLVGSCCFLVHWHLVILTGGCDAYSGGCLSCTAPTSFLCTLRILDFVVLRRICWLLRNIRFVLHCAAWVLYTVPTSFFFCCTTCGLYFVSQYSHYHVLYPVDSSFCCAQRWLHFLLHFSASLHRALRRQVVFVYSAN